MLRSILVGLDGSTHSYAAIELSIRWARQFDALVAGMAVVDEPAICRPEPVPIGGGAFKHERDEALLADARQRVAQILRAFVQRCTEREVRCEALEAVGWPGEEISRQSKSYDVIMLGQQTNFHFETQDGRDETLWKLLRTSSRPVVTVPGTLTDEERVLIAYNGSPESDRALQAFTALGLAAGREVHVLSIDDDVLAARVRAEQAVQFLTLHDIWAVPHAAERTGSVMASILSAVQELRAGMLVMGACGGWRLWEIVFGSTTAEIVQASPVPVFWSH